MIKYFLCFIIFACFSCQDSATNKTIEIPLSETDATVSICKWKDNKKAAITLQFDDATPGQATLGVQALIERDITGTWYINPGRDIYKQYRDNWQMAADMGQELANHTMTHTGASTYEETLYEVGDASKEIWDLRGEEHYSSLIAFNRGGGTSWNEEDLDTILKTFKNIDRQSNVGIKVLAKSVLPGSSADDMYEILPQVINDSIIGRVHFHGIAAENGDPPYDFGNGAVWIEEFENFLDRLVLLKNEAWIGGYIEVYKYIKEREVTTVKILEYESGSFSLKVNTSLDKNYYDESLTLLVNLPVDWNNCEVEQSGKKNIYSINENLLMFNVIPDGSDIWISEK